MSAIYKDGEWYGKGGGGGDTSSIELTQAEYDALTPEEQENGTVYYITDALPTNQICYVGSKFNRSDIYKDTETVIGSYLGKPLYQKTVNTGALPNNTEKTVSSGISNIDEVVFMFGYAKKTNKSRFIPLSYGGSTWAVSIGYDTTTDVVFIASFTDMSSYVDSYVTLQYTKTTDSANSAIYASENDYSTDETIVGTWIDGKPLYQKVFTDLNSPLNSSSWNTVCTIPNVDLVVSGWCAYNNNGTGKINILSFTEIEPYSDGTIKAQIFPSRTINMAVFQYTKTTD